VTETVAKKIKALAALTDMDSGSIQDYISNQIESILTQGIMENLGMDGVPLMGHTNPGPDFSTSGPSKPETWIPGTLGTKNNNTDDSELSVAEGLSDTTIDEFDSPLETFDDDDEEEDEMGVKNKQGEDSTFDDDVLADAQSSMEDMFGSNELEADYDSDPDERELSGIGNDAPVGDMGEKKGDHLPVDYGLNAISGTASVAGMDFFERVAQGQVGNTNLRNQVKRIRRG